ncbi:MAG: hypothetical protein NVS2B9_07800 [Myxococcales bacterium]
MQPAASARGGGERSIPTLDGWRAVAILAVVACHGVPRSSFLWPIRLFGTHGVYVFFGISGFLITTKLLDEEHRNGRIDLAAFYLRRAFRILPPALVFLGVVATLGAFSVLAPMPLREWISDAFFLQSYVGVFPGRTPYTVHFGSLAVEEHFYLVFPFLLALLGSLRVRKLIPWTCAAIALWRIADDLRVHTYQRLFPGIFPNYRTDRIADFLLWGCFLALVLRLDPVRRALERLLTNVVWMVLAAAFVLVLWKRRHGARVGVSARGRPRAGADARAGAHLLQPLSLADALLHRRAARPHLGAALSRQRDLRARLCARQLSPRREAARRPGTKARLGASEQPCSCLSRRAGRAGGGAQLHSGRGPRSGQRKGCDHRMTCPW